VSRGPYLFAAALIAVALADPVVESISNSGLVGGGYDDDNHLGVVPTLLIGALLVLTIVALRCLRILRRAASGERDWLLEAATAFSKRTASADVPYVVAMQLIALFALENVEQFATTGTFVGGAAWLGGPCLFSLVIHALAGAACTWSIGAFMRAVSRSFASFLETAIRCMWIAIGRARGAGALARRRTARIQFSQSPHVRQIGGRAPPLLAIPA